MKPWPRIALTGLLLLASCIQTTTPCSPTSRDPRYGCTDPYGRFIAPAPGGATP